MGCWRKCISGAPIKAFFALSSLLLVGSCALGGNENVVTVYFVPFEIETYVPITTATIVCEAREKWTITDASQVTRLISFLNQGKEAPFNDRRVRVQVSRDNQSYYIDSEGVALKGNSSYRINKVEFARFAESLRADQRQSIKGHRCK